MYNLCITSQYTACTSLSFISEFTTDLHLLYKFLNSLHKSEHREKFLSRRYSITKSLREFFNFNSLGRSSSTGQYSAHAPRNVEPPFSDLSPRNIILQFWQRSIVTTYRFFSSSHSWRWNALNSQFCSAEISKARNFIIASPRLFLRLMTLLYK